VKGFNDIRRGAVGLFFLLSLPVAAADAPLESSISIRLRIVDTVTQLPISGALISLRKENAGLEKLGQSTNGIFNFSHPATPETIQLRIEAEDYTTRGVTLSLTNSRIEATVPLDRRAPLRGFVVDPTGRPADRATVVVLKKRMGVIIEPNGKIETFNQARTKLTEQDGAFSLVANEEAESILAVHELGLSQTPVVGWTNGSHIRLQAWIACRGKMLINDVPAANETVSISRVMFPGTPWWVSFQRFEATTDAGGNFFFDRAPPGEITLHWRTPVGAQSYTFSHGMDFVVDQSRGEIVYHLRGRAVRGQLVVPDGKFDWNANHIFGSISAKAQPASEFTPLGIPKFGMSITANIDNNQRFEATAVPPGNYILRMRAHKADNSMQMVETELVIPDGVGPIDLGQVSMKETAR
jgi:hypothetical protein